MYLLISPQNLAHSAKGGPINTFALVFSLQNLCHSQAHNDWLQDHKFRAIRNLVQYYLGSIMTSELASSFLGILLTKKHLTSFCCNTLLVPQKALFRSNEFQGLSLIGPRERIFEQSFVHNDEFLQVLVKMALDFDSRGISSFRSGFLTLRFSLKIESFTKQNMFYRSDILHDFSISSF